MELDPQPWTRHINNRGLKRYATERLGQGTRFAEEAVWNPRPEYEQSIQSYPESVYDDGRDPA